MVLQHLNEDTNLAAYTLKTSYTIAAKHFPAAIVSNDEFDEHLPGKEAGRTRDPTPSISDKEPKQVLQLSMDVWRRFVALLTNFPLLPSSSLSIEGCQVAGQHKEMQEFQWLCNISSSHQQRRRAKETRNKTESQQVPSSRKISFVGKGTIGKSEEPNGTKVDRKGKAVASPIQGSPNDHPIRSYEDPISPSQA